MIKRTNRVALSGMQKVALVWSSARGNREVNPYSLTNRKPVPSTPFIFHAVEKMQHRWSMYLIAVAVSSTGKKLVRYERILCKAPGSHTNLVSVFNERHERLLNSLHAKYEKQAAWIATVNEIELTDAQIHELTGI